MAVGYNALNSLTSGGGNVAIGRRVLSKVEGEVKMLELEDGGNTNCRWSSWGNLTCERISKHLHWSRNSSIGAHTNNETVIGQGALAGKQPRLFLEMMATVTY